MNNKHFSAIILLSLIVPVFIILFNLNLQLYNTGFAVEEFEKNNVYGSIEKETVLANYRLLIGYFRGDNNLAQSFFNTREKAHLADVAYLFKLARYALYAVILLLALLVFYFIKKRQFADLKTALVFGNVLFIVFVIFLFMLLLLDFPGIFESFHLVAFSNNLWQLNPETDRLIVMFPEGFFFDSVVNIMVNSFITIFVIFAIVAALGFYIGHKSKLLFFDFKPK